MALTLIKDFMCSNAIQQVALWKYLAGVELDDTFQLEQFFDRDRMMLTLNPLAKLGYPDAVDYSILYMVTAEAQTYLFDTEQIRLFLRAIDKKVPPRTVEPPFPSVVIQFTQPIPEEELTSGAYTWSNVMPEDQSHSTGDLVTGFVVAFPQATAQAAAQAGVIQAPGMSDVANVILFYQSGALNRSAASIDGDGSVTNRYTEGWASDDAKQDKQRIVNLAMLTLSYLNSPGIETEKVETPAAIQKRRQKDGKRPIEPYYVCKVQKRHYVASGAAGEPSGRHVSFRFDVQGHFRHYKSGKTVWVQSHQRGLEHERYVPKVYRVDEGEDK